VLGMIIGGIVGSRLKKKIDLRRLSIDQLVCFRVKCIIKWT
jgi:hypothetical protein